jgi:hypothetical protein
MADSESPGLAMTEQEGGTSLPVAVLRNLGPRHLRGALACKRVRGVNLTPVQTCHFVRALDKP